MNIDFKLLKAQKLVLNYMTEKQCLDDADRLAIEGILTLIDCIQDEAIENGSDEYEVLSLSHDDDDDELTPMTIDEAKQIIESNYL